MEEPLPEQFLELGLLRRRAEFRVFLQAIDFGRLKLLDNTVTMIALTLAEEVESPIPLRSELEPSENLLIAVAHQMRCDITEDPVRVIYPALDEVQKLPAFNASCLENAEFLAPTVSVVRYKQRKLAYKTIDRPIYEPGDTKHILNEIAVLAEFRGHPNIAQLIGLVVSKYPYKTYQSTEMPLVVTGFLLDFYPGGSLQRIIDEGGAQDCSLRLRWATQVGTALVSLHERGRTHLDIKPSNVVFDGENNAFLIDISGTGGYEWEWLSPEMQKLIQDSEAAPADTSFDSRTATDSWAYGKLLSAIAGSGPGTTCEKLRHIACCLMKDTLIDRISIRDALAMVEDGN